MLVSSEQQMLEFGEKIAKSLSAPLVIELLGDVGAENEVPGLAEFLGGVRGIAVDADHDVAFPLCIWRRPQIDIFLLTVWPTCNYCICLISWNSVC